MCKRTTCTLLHFLDTPAHLCHLDDAQLRYFSLNNLQLPKYSHHRLLMSLLALTMLLIAKQKNTRGINAWQLMQLTMDQLLTGDITWPPSCCPEERATHTCFIKEGKSSGKRGLSLSATSHTLVTMSLHSLPLWPVSYSVGSWASYLENSLKKKNPENCQLRHHLKCHISRFEY